MAVVSSGKFLIINADDFGVNESTNKAVLELFEQGLITSASLLTVASRSKAAADMAAQGNLPVGVHLTINSDDAENRWQSNSGAKSLSDGKGLYCDAKKITLKAKSADVSAELEAQYRFMTANGCKPDHADSHCGTLYGINGRLFFINAFRFCKEHGLPFRFPRKSTFLDRQFGGKAPAPIVLLQKGIIKLADRYKIDLLDDMISNPFPIRKIKSYEELRGFYIREVLNLAPGVTEMFFHPAYPAGDAPSGPESEWLKREYELRLLKSGDLHEAVFKNKIHLVSWPEAFG